MKKTLISFFLIALVCACSNKSGSSSPAVYEVAKLETSMPVDGNWDKPQWKSIKPLDMTHYMGTVPPFHPTAQARMAYNDSNLFVIFRVEDRFVKSATQEFNGPVSQDACVEFFFSPDLRLPEAYYNLEVNCGGTPLMSYHTSPGGSYTNLTADDFGMIEIAHSMPARVDPEIETPVTWTIEYRVRLTLLEKFAQAPHPAPGVVWKANFYKTASKTSNPHYLTWSVVDYPTPNFHLPKYFGTLQFK